MARKKTEESKVELKPIKLAVDPDTHQMARELAAKEGVSMTVFAKQHFSDLVKEMYKKRK
mgnify:CR=1 FL=1